MSLVVLATINTCAVFKFDELYASLQVLPYVILYGSDPVIYTELTLWGFLLPQEMLSTQNVFFRLYILCVFKKYKIQFRVLSSGSRPYCFVVNIRRPDLNIWHFGWRHWSPHCMLSSLAVADGKSVLLRNRSGVISSDFDDL